VEQRLCVVQRELGVNTFYTVLLFKQMFVLSVKIVKYIYIALSTI